jgi:hypothetical protein
LASPNQQVSPTGGSPGRGPTSPLNPVQLKEKLNVQVYVYTQELLSKTLKAVIEKMPAPEENALFIDTSGQVRNKKAENTQNSAFHKTCKNILKNICGLSWESTRLTLQFKLERLLDGTEFTEMNLSRICWAIGCLKEKMPMEDFNFLVTTFRALLFLAESKATKHTKAIIIANMYYTISKFSYFLIKSPNFTFVT